MFLVTMNLGGTNKKIMDPRIQSLNKNLCYFTIDETKDFSYEETVQNLKSALSWEIQHPDYMASISEMQALEHDRRIITSL